MRKRLQVWLTKQFFRAPALQQFLIETRDTIQAQTRLLNESAAREHDYRSEYVERCAELVEARAMAGAGPWLNEGNRSSLSEGRMALAESDVVTIGLREDISPGAIGAYGDIELALQNVEWRREINLSWLEFSRWGIQQIILISRLYYIKNPLIRRGIDISAVYVFGRGVEVTTNDEAANETLSEFFERNRRVLGQIALVDLERRKYYDGNLFFVLFADTENKGTVDIRTFDAAEMQDIITDPNDADKPQYYRRQWTQRDIDYVTGNASRKTMEAWYPALGFEPDNRPAKIGNIPVMWENPVLHRKCGSVSKWLFGCPLVYPALDWAKAARRFLESCATLKASLATIAWNITTKGGQQAIEGIKQQLQTTVGPPTNAWDTNPPPVNGAVLATGPGTKMEMLNSTGKGGDPEEVRKFIHMVAMVFGIPETFFADVESGNLATAQTLDRPTELNFVEKQEAWVEDLTTIAGYVLKVSAGAPSGTLRESLKATKPNIIAAKLIKKLKNGVRVYEAAKDIKQGTIQIRVNFPAIREGDIPALVTAGVQALTLGNSQGQIVGIDEMAGIRYLLTLLDIENPEDILNAMFPAGSYDPDRTKEPEPLPTDPNAPQPNPKMKEARRLIGEALERLVAQ